MPPHIINNFGKLLLSSEENDPFKFIIADMKIIGDIVSFNVQLPKPANYIILNLNY